MYSLVSAPVLGFDLARLQDGSAVADVLLRGLSVTDGDLTAISAARTGEAERAVLWRDVAAAARTRRSLIARTRAVEDGGMELTGAVGLLERAPIGTVDGLLHCLRYDVLDWTWTTPTTPAAPAQGRIPAPRTPATQSGAAEAATEILSDAVAATYLRDLLPERTRNRLAEPWAAVAGALPDRPLDLGPQRAALERLLERVATMNQVDLRRLVEGAERVRPKLADWAPAVHSASWAVFLSGRIRAAAAAQLLLVKSIDRAGVPVAARAGGVWNLLSGAVQALMVRDLLDSANVHRLLDPYFVAMGPLAR